MRGSLPLALLNDVFWTGKGNRSGWKGIVKDAVEHEWPVTGSPAAAPAPEQDPVLFNRMVGSTHATVRRNEWILDGARAPQVLLLDDLENKLVRWARQQSKRLRSQSEPLAGSYSAKAIVEDVDSIRELDALKAGYAERFESSDEAMVRRDLGVGAAKTAEDLLPADASAPGSRADEGCGPSD